MCEKPLIAWLCSKPYKPFIGCKILTRQYNEPIQENKDYLVFKSNRGYKITSMFSKVDEVQVPCGKCIQCQYSKAQNWSCRSTLEMQKYQQACVLTLTYSSDFLPDNGLIRYKDIQDFLKKLRWHLQRIDRNKKIKFMCACEYGRSGSIRPHYHLIIFNWFPEDVNILQPYKRTKKGSLLYKSKFLTDLWSFGFVDVGTVNHQTCRYVSQYCVKKFTSYNPIYVNKCKQERERLRASQGFGLDWFKKNYKSVLEKGRILIGGFSFSIPKYFINKLEIINEKVYNEIKQKFKLLWISKKFTEEEIRRSSACSDKILSRLKIFNNINDLDFCLS